MKQEKLLKMIVYVDVDTLKKNLKKASAQQLGYDALRQRIGWGA